MRPRPALRRYCTAKYLVTLTRALILLRYFALEGVNRRLEIGKPRQQRSSQKLEVSDHHREFFQSAVSIGHLGFDPIKGSVIGRITGQIFIGAIAGDQRCLCANILDTPTETPVLGFGRLQRVIDGGCDRANPGPISLGGHRHGSRTRSLTGTFGPIEIAVPRARLTTPKGGTAEWKSQALRAYQRRTLAADALIASSYLAGTNTRRVRRALTALFGGTVGKDTVSRTWRKVKGDWDAWNSRSLAAEPIVRLILDGTVVRVRLDRKATSISLLVVLVVRADGQKVRLAIKSMGGESAEAWRTVLERDGSSLNRLRIPKSERF